jgi:FtsH-binding integral membrane protein
MTVNVYNNEGKKIGKAREDDPLGSLIGGVLFLGILGIAIASLVEWLSARILNWEKLSPPYNYIAAYYDYSLRPILASFADAWAWSAAHAFPGYPNLNLTLSVLSVLAYAALILFIARIIIAAIDRYVSEGLGYPVLVALLLGPGFVAAVWFLGEWSLDWLLATKARA